MQYALLTVPVFGLLCFLLGLPLTRLLLAKAPRSSHLFLAPAVGFAVLITFVEIAVKIIGTIETWWWALWVLAAISAATLTALTVRDLRAKEGPMRVLEGGKFEFATAALGIAAIYAALIALPLVGDVSYAIFRTNSSDANVNITMADAWVNAPWRTINAYVSSIGTPSQAPETIKIVADAPISIFSARFIGTEVRLATSMLIGLYAELFRLPPYLAYFPLMLATAGIAAVTAFGMLRSMGASTWFALIIAASVIGGWDYMVRESDNNNQHATLPALIGALYLLYLRFDGAWNGARIRSGIAIALMFAAAITPYPEIGIGFGGAIGGALVIGGLVRLRGLDHWITAGVIVLATLVLLVVNGQALILWKWFGLVESGALGLNSFTGPSGDYIETWGVVGVAGLPRMPIANTLLPYFAWGVLGGSALVVLAWGWRSFTGLAVLLYAAGMCAIAAYGMYVSGVPYIAYRAASFLGFVAIICCAAALAAGRSAPKNAQLALRLVPLAAMGFLAISVVAGLQFWAGSFTRQAKGYSMMSQRDFKSQVSNLRSIRGALSENASAGLAVYLPPMSANSTPWDSTINAYMTAAPFDPVFLSGLMHDNKDVRMPIRGQMYDTPEEKARTISLLLADGVHSPVPSLIKGELIASDNAFRLYRIAPTPVSTLMNLLAEPSGE